MARRTAVVRKGVKIVQEGSPRTNPMCLQTPPLHKLSLDTISTTIMLTI